MSNEGPEWCLMESDPGVFEELIKRMGVTGLAVEELYTMTEEELEEFRPIYGLIFLFKWEGEKSNYNPQLIGEAPSNLFFAQQIVRNACATQAILSIVLNIDNPDIAIGPSMTEFKSFAEPLPSDMKGHALSNSDFIRQAHNSFSRPDVFYMEDAKSAAQEDAFHFIAYIQKDGKIFELDGLQSAPAFVGECEESKDWSNIALEHVQKRMKLYNSSEIRFNLLVVCGDLEKNIHGQREAVMANVQDEKKQCALLSQLEEKLLYYRERRESFREENARRCHNFFPLIFALLESVAKKI